MDTSANPNPTADLADAIRQLAATNERIAQSLANLESLYAAEVSRHEEQRKDTIERQKRMDERQKQFDERQKVWDERNKKWEEQREKVAAIPARLSWQSCATLLLIVTLLLAVAQ